MKAQKGIPALPDLKTRNRISDETGNIVTAFYENDEYSNLMPVIVDYVSFIQNVHKRKQLLLCTFFLTLYASFKKQHPDEKISFSKFCALHPKRYLIIGSAGTHFLCVYTTHQNVILK